MAIVFVTLDEVTLERLAVRPLVLADAVWEKLFVPTRAGRLEISAREDAKRELAPIIAAARAQCEPEAAALERWLHAGGSLAIGWEIGAARPAEEAVRGPSLTIGKGSASITHGHGDGELLAIARSDGRVEVWDLSSRSRVLAFAGAASVQYVEEPDELAGPIRVHLGDPVPQGVDDLKVDRALAQLALSRGNLLELIALDGTTRWQRACGGANARLAFTQDGSVLRWASDEWGFFPRHNGEPQAYTAPLITAVSVDGARMLVAYDSGEIDLQGESPGTIAPAGSARVERVALVAGDDRIAVATHHALSLIDGSGAWHSADLGVTDVATWAAAGAGHLFVEGQAPSHVLNCLVASPDGRLIAAGGRFTACDLAVGTLWLWDKTSAPKLLAPPGERHSHPVIALAFTTDGRLVSLDAHSLRLWSRDGAPIDVLAAGVAELAGMHVTASEIWAYGNDGSIYGWSIPT